MNTWKEDVFILYIYETVVYYWTRCKPGYNESLQFYNSRK